MRERQSVYLGRRRRGGVDGGRSMMENKYFLSPLPLHVTAPPPHARKRRIFRKCQPTDIFETSPAKCKKYVGCLSKPILFGCGPFSAPFSPRGRWICGDGIRAWGGGERVRWEKKGDKAERKRSQETVFARGGGGGSLWGGSVCVLVCALPLTPKREGKPSKRTTDKSKRTRLGGRG